MTDSPATIASTTADTSVVVTGSSDDSKKASVGVARTRNSKDPDWHDADDPFRVEHWYPRLRHHTFATDTMPLLHREARTICRWRDLQRVLLLSRDQEERTRNPGAPSGPATWTHEVYASLATQVMNALSDDERAILTGLTTRLQELIDHVTSITFNSPTPLAVTPAAAAASGETKALITDEVASPAVPATTATATPPVVDSSSTVHAHAHAHAHPHPHPHPAAALIHPPEASPTSSSVGVFVRLSTRSPKDAALTGARIESIIRRDIAASKYTGGTPEADVEDVIIFTRALGEALRVNNASEALQLLLTSQRAYDDIARTELIQGGDPATFDMKLIVRRWHNIDVEWEFRAWVYNGKLTACTQYYDYCHVPAMVGRRDAITKHLHDKFEQVRELIDIANYTIDFAVSPTLDLAHTYVVEINHLPPEAGTSLFDWGKLDDRKLIENGPFTLRILDTPLPSAKKGLHPPLRRFIHSLRGVDDSKYETLSHKDVGCDGCRRHPITSVWYRCFKCRDYDLCIACYEAKQHYPGDASHVFHKMESSAEHDDMDTLLDEKLAATRGPAAKKSSSSSSISGGGGPRKNRGVCVVS